MLGEEPHLTRLELRKRLLVAESELNRAALSEEWRTVSGGVHGIAGPVKALSSCASAVGMVAAGLASFRQGKRAPAREAPSWFDIVLSGAQLACAIRLAIRSKQA